jgi:quercetin dioxygenase-like cupin family protein
MTGVSGLTAIAALGARVRLGVRLWVRVGVCLGVCLGACAAPPASLAPSHALPDPLQAGWKGEKVCEPLFENDAVRAARCTFPPGVGHERHFHAPHFGYILEGSTMRTTSAEGVVERVLQSGATWWSDGVDWHEVVNIGDTTGVYLIIEPK